MKVTLSNTNNIGYKYLEGQKGELSIDEQNNKFVFDFLDKDGIQRTLTSPINGQLGQLGNTYLSPEITFVTGSCTFSFDQREREQEKSTPSIISYKEYEKLTNDFIDARRNYERNRSDPVAQKAFAEAKNAFEPVADAVSKGQVTVVTDLNTYMRDYIKNSEEKEGQIGNLKFSKISCSDITAIYVDKGDNQSNDEIAAIYLQGEIRMMNGCNNLEESVMKAAEEIGDEQSMHPLNTDDLCMS